MATEYQEINLVGFNSLKKRWRQSAYRRRFLHLYHDWERDIRQDAKGLFEMVAYAARSLSLNDQRSISTVRLQAFAVHVN
jgi:hypothetical protein